MAESGTNFEVESGVSLFDGKPFVAIGLGTAHQKMRPAKAREIALMILECAEAAEQDAAINDFMKTKMNGSAEDGARMIAMVREYRQQFRGLEEGGQ